jgi:RHS repeat-associated protein
VRSYSYDHANRLTQVTEGSLTTQFAYNGDGVRTSKTVAGDTTDYVLDLLAKLPVVISDTEAVYLYGLDIIAQQQTERLYYVHDGLGSVRHPSTGLRAGLVDSTGQLATNYAYDPFGVPLVGGEVYNPYQYTGEAWDAEVELLYLRARYYQPEVGRFITRDPWTGDSDRPATLNLYAYALNNAVNLMDRSGYEACMDIHCEAPIVDPNLKSKADRLEQDYGILVGRRQMSRGVAGVRSMSYALWSDWEALQLDIVRFAAGDMARLMQGGEAGFKARLAPVYLYRSEEGSRPLGYRGLATLGGVTLSGLKSDWFPIQEMKWTIVHELAHWWDLNRWGEMSRGMVVGGMWGAVWPSERAECRVYWRLDLEVREWQLGKLGTPKPANLLEDWAESVATYVYHEYAPNALSRYYGPKYMSESRWNYVAQLMNPQYPKTYPWEWSLKIERPPSSMGPSSEGSRLPPER